MSSWRSSCHQYRLHHFMLQQNPGWFDSLVLAFPRCPGKWPYLTLPSRVDILPPSTEASNEHNTYPRINHKVTKSPSVVHTWVHTNNGTIPPLQLRTPTWLTHYHTLVISPRKHQLQMQINPGNNDLQIFREIQGTDPRLKHKFIKSPSAIPTWVLSIIRTNPLRIEGAHLDSPAIMLMHSALQENTNFKNTSIWLQ